MRFKDKKSNALKPATRTRSGKVPGRSLHGDAVQVSVDERVADLVRRFPALHSAVGPLLVERKKRIRDFPAPDQVRILRMVYALKKASRV